MIRLGLISYLNTAPFIHGLESLMDSQEISISICQPSIAADKLIKNELDLAIVPIAILSKLEEAYIVSDYCIGADKIVESVLVCSNTPIYSVDTIFLDQDSLTSAMLTKILANHYWNISPRYINKTYTEVDINLHKELSEGQACLMIGDKAMRYSHSFKYVYDLAKEWYSFRGLPFVFACWISNKPLDTEFLRKFNSALEYGVNHKKDAISKNSYGFNADFALNYLNNSISYKLDAQKKKGFIDFWSLSPEDFRCKVRW